MNEDECPKSVSGLHDMRFKKREVIGTVAFNTYKCRHCGEELNIEVLPWGRDDDREEEE